MLTIRSGRVDRRRSLVIYFDCLYLEDTVLLEGSSLAWRNLTTQILTSAGKVR